jgi:HAE1 family hydrophobic/amphiphilic exporter-1
LNISELFIKRPIATSLLMLGIAVFGIIAYFALPVSDLPNVDFPTLSVMASLPGADPATMASAVATPLERQFTGIAGLDSMTSTSSLGSTNITLQFDLSRKIDGAAVDVQTAIAEAMPLLPAGMPTPPSFWKFNPADMPVLFMGLTSGTLPMYKVDDYAETSVAQRISMVSGVARVNIMGAQKYAVRIQLDPDSMNAKQIGINEVAAAVQGWNTNQPTGTLFGPKQAFNVLANGQLMNADAYKPMIIAWRNGSPVRLQDIATIKDSVEDDKNGSWIYSHDNGLRAVNLMVMRQPGSNTIEVTDGVRNLFKTFQAQLPPTLKLDVRMDKSQQIRAAFGDIQATMMITLVLVILVIFLFLRNVSATAIPAMALPFSILGTFAVIYALGFSLNNLSMMALILCIGFVVDDAIVMLENIFRHMEHGERAMAASLRGSREIGFTIVSMTVSLAAVFIPVLFMGGILGRLFKEFAVTICTAILISGMVSITLTPMLCSRFLRTAKTTGRGIFYRATEAAFDGMLNAYAHCLRWIMRHRPVMAGVFFISLAATVYMYGKVSKGFIPDQDQDRLNITAEAIQGTSYYKMLEYKDQIAAVLQKEPEIDSFFASIGGGFRSSGSNQAQFDLQLKPRRVRKHSAQQLVAMLRPKIMGFEGFRAFLTMPPSIRIGGRMSKSSYEFTIQAPDTVELYKQATVLEKALATELPDLIQDVTSDLQIRSPRINLEIDRDKAAAMQLDANQIESALYNAYGPSWVSTIYAPNNQYRVLTELQPKYQTFSDYLTKLYFKPPNGHVIPLDSILKQRIDAGPLSINHSGQLPSVTVSFNVRPGVALGDAVDGIKEVAARVLPATVTTAFTGTAAAFQSSLKNLGFLMGIAIAVVYIVLGVLYESYVHPITILSGLPSAGLGALLTLSLFHEDLNIYSFVGLMMLVGIVKKNAIMQIDFALAAERNEKKSPTEAMYEGCLVRFRPIMMTTAAALLGSIPIALGYGSGGEARRPLGLAVVGGLIFSQMITLFLTPVVYTYMAAFQDFWQNRTKKKGRRIPALLTPAPAPAGNVALRENIAG